jgi:GTP-binding protein
MTRKLPVPAGAATERPIVAIVGRPNVGKSTLFNRLAQQRLAIVEDVPGVTRDRHYADTTLGGREVVLVDTGGFDPESDDPMKEGIAHHVRLALEEADVVVCTLDATTGATKADRAAIDLLRRAAKPVIYAANKADSKAHAMAGMELYELGVPHIVAISALHGHGMGELEDAIAAALPERAEHAGVAWDEKIPRVAIVGRPNAGKSSLVNRLLGEERQLVDARPGTTVDAIDALYQRDGERWVLIDTAGIRRKRGIERGVEGLAVMKALRAIERSHLAIMLVDATEGVAEQDARLAGIVAERGRAMVVGLNKADLLDEREQKKAISRARDVLAFASWARVVPISAKTGRGVGKLVDAAGRALADHDKRVTTAELNRFFEEVLEHHPPPTQKGKPVRLYYVTQAEVRPPRFVVVVNEPSLVHWSYERYVANALRERFGFEGTPLRINWKRKSRRD